MKYNFISRNVVRIDYKRSVEYHDENFENI